MEKRRVIKKKRVVKRKVVKRNATAPAPDLPGGTGLARTVKGTFAYLSAAAFALDTEVPRVVRIDNAEEGWRAYAVFVHDYTGPWKCVAADERVLWIMTGDPRRTAAELRARGLTSQWLEPGTEPGKETETHD